MWQKIKEILKCFIKVLFLSFSLFLLGIGINNLRQGEYEKAILTMLGANLFISALTEEQSDD